MPSVKYRPIPPLTEKQIARFWNSFDRRADGCWIWTGSTIGGKGYGLFGISPRQFRAHRISYKINSNEDPGQLLVMHKCDVRLCVNPAHLTLGTYVDNQNDMARKGRAAKGPRHAFALHPEAFLKKLTKAQVANIRSRYVKGYGLGIKGNGAQLAEEFGVSKTMIYLIARGIKHRDTYDPNG